MGGCQNFKMSEIDSEWFEGTYKTASETDNQLFGLLTQQQRYAWEQNVYIEGIPNANFWDQNCQYKHECFKQIKKDIRRTYPDSPFFGNIKNINRFELLLQKFAIYFPKIGYTQGINFLAGYLLLCGFDDQAAFNILVRISVHEKILTIGLYQDQFPLNRFYCEVFWKLLDKKMPKISKRLIQSRLPDQSWIFQWFLSYYLYSFPIELMRCFWGFMLSKKQFSLVLIALGIVKCLKRDLVEINDEFEFFEYFDSLKSIDIVKIKIDPRKVLNYARNITKSEIDQAIQATSCHNNPYKRYFMTPMYQAERWVSIIKKLQADRASFKMNPHSQIYIRNRQTTQFLQNFMLQKFKLYRSDFRVHKNTFRQSNFSIIKDVSVVHSLLEGEDFTKKLNQISQNEQKKNKQRIIKPYQI